LPKLLLAEITSRRNFFSLQLLQAEAGWKPALPGGAFAQGSTVFPVLRCGWLDWQGKGKLCAYSNLAFDSYGATMQFDKGFANRQAQSGARC
jgi:hypothetical protein